MKLLNKFNKIKESILNVLLPISCVGCGREGQYICKSCEVFLSETPPAKEVSSVWTYEGLTEKLIYKIKYDGCYQIISELVEKAFVKIDLKLFPDTYITYVPMFKKREKLRGFNQSALLAQKLGHCLPGASNSPWPVTSLLEKIKDNRSQVGLNPKEREENVKGVFKFCGEAAPKNILLVDDVYTTGATTKECCRVLKKAGVKNISIFTLARTV